MYKELLLLLLIILITLGNKNTLGKIYTVKQLSYI